MTVEYEKDKDTGVVSQNFDGTVELASQDRPVLPDAGPDPENPTQEYVEASAALSVWVRGRNHGGRVFIPAGETFSVVVKTKGKEFPICTGTSAAPTSKKLCPIFVRVRQEFECDEPVDPATKIAEIG